MQRSGGSRKLLQEKQNFAALSKGEVMRKRVPPGVQVKAKVSM